MSGNQSVEVHIHVINRPTYHAQSINIALGIAQTFTNYADIYRECNFADENNHDDDDDDDDEYADDDDDDDGDDDE